MLPLLRDQLKPPECAAAVRTLPGTHALADSGYCSQHVLLSVIKVIIYIMKPSTNQVVVAYIFDPST